MRTLVLLAALAFPAVAHGQWFQPQIVGAGHPSSPRYGAYHAYHYQRYQPRYRSFYSAPAYRAPVYRSYRRRPDIMTELRQTWMQQDIEDIANSLRR